MLIEYFLFLFLGDHSENKPLFGHNEDKEELFSVLNVEIKF